MSYQEEGYTNNNKMADDLSKIIKDPNSIENNREIEQAWAIKSYHHAEIYLNLITSVDASLLRLTQIDDDIYTLFRQQFPDMQIDMINEDNMKSKANKEKWRAFCNEFDESVEDFNFATLLRLNCKSDYVDANTTIAPRIQFLAIEIARNREGLNKNITKTDSSNNTETNTASQETNTITAEAS